MTTFFRRFWFAFAAIAVVVGFSEYAVSSHPGLKLLLSTSGHTVFKMVYTGHVDATPKGTTMRGVRIVVRNPRTRDFDLGFATERFVGKITPDTPGSPLPKTIIFGYLHKLPTGAVKAKISFTLKVESDGRILTQDFRVIPLDHIAPRDSVEFTESPGDAALPAATFNFTASEITGLFTRNYLEPEDADDPRPDQDSSLTSPVRRIQFAPFMFADDTKKGAIISSFDMKLLPVAGLSLQGKLVVVGSLSEGRPPVFPKTINIVIDHRNLNTKAIISTDTLPMKVQSTGTILQQTFPFTTNTTGIPEFLRISFVPADADFHHCRFGVKFTFVQTS